MKRSSKRSSEILHDLKQELNGNMTYRALIQAFGKRAFAIAILFFALPSALPFSVIPGVSVIFTIPIMIFSLQMIFGKRLWLPKKIADHIIPKQKIEKMVNKTVPYLRKVEYLLRPRILFMSSPIMEIMSGIMIFTLAIFLSLPIPFSNFIIAALIIIFCLGMAEQDGLLILFGYLGTIIYIALMFFVILVSFRTLFF